VKKDSPLQTPLDLKGKTLAAVALQSTGHMLIREALALKFGLNVALDGGDFKQVEILAPNMPAALATGRVDAATLQNSQAFRAMQSGEFRNICETTQIIIERHGRTVNSVNVSYPERLAERKDQFVEFSRMLKASVEYAKANRPEVFGAVGKQANIDPAFFDWRYDRATEIPAVLTADHLKSIEMVWELSKKYKMIQASPKIESVVWEHALRA
jgi:NitT/TauT family transport system substrate-binding protein